MPETVFVVWYRKNQQKLAGQAKRPEETKLGNLWSHGTASFQNAPQNNTPPTRNPLGTGKQAALLICGGSPSRSHFVIERFGCLWFQIMAPIGVPRNPNWALIVLGSVAWGHGQLSCHIWQPWRCHEVVLKFRLGLKRVSPVIFSKMPDNAVLIWRYHIYYIYIYIYIY